MLLRNKCVKGDINLTYIISECGVNWRTLSEADEMIKQSAKAGVDMCKFQAFKSEGYPIGSFLYNHALKEEDIRYLYYRCQYHGISFMCTPMYPAAVEMLNPYVEMWKIRFADRNNIEIIKKCLLTEKEILISDTEPSTYGNKNTIKTLYCVPEYPPTTDWDIVNKVKGFDGFSSHFPNWKIPWYVVKNNDLDYLEVHVRLNKYHPNWEPLDQRVSITMKELGKLCREIQ